MKYRPFVFILAIFGTAMVSGCANLPPHTDASSQLQHSANQGDANSQYRMGLLYTSNPPQDYAEAAKWFRKSAKQGNRDAQYMLGISYYVGRGIGRDDVLARNWFQRAAEQGHPRAQYQLGKIYMNGRSVPKERAWASLWYGKAAEQAHAEAQFSLGVAFARGLGLPINRVRSCQWLRLANRSGQAMAGDLSRRICSALSSEQRKRAQHLANGWQARDHSFYEDPPTIRYIQFRLQQLGYDPGYVDGVNGEQTRIAVASYLSASDTPVKDASMKSLVNSLRETF